MNPFPQFGLAQGEHLRQGIETEKSFTPIK
jgi:hypothetical protein